MITTACLPSLLVLPLWASGQSASILGLRAFLIQVFVQGAWEIVPVHLDELSPAAIRGTFPGLMYRLGSFFASGNATIRSRIGDAVGKNCS